MYFRSFPVGHQWAFCDYPMKDLGGSLVLGGPSCMQLLVYGLCLMLAYFLLQLHVCKEMVMPHVCVHVIPSHYIGRECCMTWMLVGEGQGLCAPGA